MKNLSTPALALLLLLALSASGISAGDSTATRPASGSVHSRQPQPSGESGESGDAGETGETGESGDAGETGEGRLAEDTGRTDEIRKIERIENRFRRNHLGAQSRFQADTDGCAAHSYGEVHIFFLKQPCSALSRAQFTITDGRGNIALVAVSWVEMPDLDSARAFQELVDDTQGTGNITELSREAGPYQAVAYSGDAYGSRRRGLVVTSAQAEPVTLDWAGIPLATVAADAVR
ncbi:collagen-like protein [Parafrankia sp. EUN1f]|uniref:collagen-like protein n=1 Tax=Parafrankia sp. EUN1f TaxID=102897 RepID=UPI0002DB4220|nr:collagen-like protein [Parafrankia sp. EUN1f]